MSDVKITLVALTVAETIGVVFMAFVAVHAFIDPSGGLLAGLIACCLTVAVGSVLFSVLREMWLDR